MKFAVATLLHPYVFAEIAETVADGLRTLGHEVTLLTGKLDARATNIVLCPHAIALDDLPRLPPGTILYNFEPLEQKPAARRLAERCAAVAHLTWWDYSRRNVEELLALGMGARCRHVPLGHCDALDRIPRKADPNIDVLFYGSMSQRRMRVLTELLAGVRFVYLHNVFGSFRDQLIAEARIVLNVQYGHSNILEYPRVQYLLSNGKAVVSERTPGMDVEPWIEQAMQLCAYEDIAATCRALLADDDRRLRLEECARELSRRQNEAAVLRAALA